MENKGVPTSVGLFVVNNDGLILIAHPSYGGQWSIPKGHIEIEDGSLLNTALRECREEVGVDVSKYKGKFFDLGQIPYVHGKKNLHAYVFFSEEPITDTLKCTAFFQSGPNKNTPEMDAFKWVPYEEALSSVHYTQVKLLERNRPLFKDPTSRK